MHGKHENPQTPPVCQFLKHVSRFFSLSGIHAIDLSKCVGFGNHADALGIPRNLAKNKPFGSG